MSDIHSVCKRFCDINKDHWGEMAEGRHAVLINVSGAPQATVISGITGRIFNEKKHLRPVVLLSSSTKKHDVTKAVFQSFGITRFLRFSRNRWTKPLSLLKAYMARRKAIKMINLDGFEYFIRNYEIDDIALGDLIYDSFIRYDHTYVDPENKKKKIKKTLLNSLWLYYSCRSVLDKESVRSVVISETVYGISESLLLRIATHMEINVMYVDLLYAKIYTCASETYYDRFRVDPELLEQAKKNRDRKKIVDEYLEKRFSGDIEHIDVINAYSGKRNWNRNELAEYFGIDKGCIHNKNVFIMPHCFSDANHKTRHLLFRDHYQWFGETLKVIRNVKNVNWFVKPHPSSKIFDEEGRVEALLEGLVGDGVYLVPLDFSTESVFDIADAVVTVNGTVGMEASAVGIRTILAGEANYSGHGYTLLADSVEAYLDLLYNMSSVRPLSKKEVECARDVLFCFQFFTRPRSGLIPDGGIWPGSTSAEVEDAYIRYFGMMADNFSSKKFAEDEHVLSLRNLIDRGHGSIMMVD